MSPILSNPRAGCSVRIKQRIMCVSAFCCVLLAIIVVVIIASRTRTSNAGKSNKKKCQVKHISVRGSKYFFS